MGRSLKYKKKTIIKNFPSYPYHYKKEKPEKPWILMHEFPDLEKTNHLFWVTDIMNMQQKHQRNQLYTDMWKPVGEFLFLK